MEPQTTAIVPVNANGKEERRSLTLSADNLLLMEILNRQQEWNLPYIGQTLKRLVEVGLAQSKPSVQQTEVGKVQLWPLRLAPPNLVVRLPFDWTMSAKRFWVGTSPKYPGWRQDLPFAIEGSVELASAQLFWL